MSCLSGLWLRMIPQGLEVLVAAITVGQVVDQIISQG